VIFFGDLETYSPTPIGAGTYRYAEDAEILLFAYAVADGPVRVVDFTDTYHTCGSPAQGVIDGLRDSNSIVFHNAMFDRTVLRLKYPHLCPPLERWHDTMVIALSHSLPGGLGALCDILGVPTDKSKDKRGRELIHLFCKPQRDGSRATRETHPKQWAEFVEYARLDVEAMRACWKKLPRWNWTARDRALWHLDQRINDRGFLVDQDLARAAIATVEAERRHLAARTAEVTNGDVGSTTQRDALLAHLLLDYGVDLPDMTKDTLERRANDENLPAEVRELIANRLQAASASPAKYRALLRGVSSDGRLRGTTQFRGASRTGRSAGRMFQPQNLPRTSKRVKKIYDDAIDAIKAGALADVEENPIEVCAEVVRGAVVAPEGKVLGVSDLSNIEGRVLAWLAGEQWKLQAFRDLDEGKGHDLYALAYSRSFPGTTPEQVMEDDAAGGIKRQIGKVEELALGYQGSVGAFVSMAAVYRIDLPAMAAKVLPTLSKGALLSSTTAWHGAGERKQTYGLERDTYVAIHAIVMAWRRANSSITDLWRDVEEAARAVIAGIGARHVGRLVFDRAGAWLRIRLPSGRFLCYPSPRIGDDGKITAMGMNQYTKKWSRLAYYGGKFVENITQAVAADVLWHGIERVESAGPVVMHVHDEVVAEMGELRAFDIGAIFAAPPPWAHGLPLAAGAFFTTRYRKG